MQVSIAKSSWFNERGVRFDASFHLSSARKATQLFKNSSGPIQDLTSLTKHIYSGHRFKRYYVSNSENGIPFMGGSDMLKSDFVSLKLISKKLTKSINDLRLGKGWTLVTRSGTIGRTAYVREDFLDKVATEDVIRIIPDDKKIFPGFLYAFLSCKYGYALLTQSTYGGVIQHIEPHHIINLPVPHFSTKTQSLIHKLIEEASTLRVLSNNLLIRATKIFDDKFFVDKKKYHVAFKKNILKFNFSWAGRNNDKVAELILEKIRKEKHFIMGEIADKIFSPPIFKHIYLDKNNGNPFYTGGELSQIYRPMYRFLSKRGVTNIDDYKINTGTILIYKSGPRDGMLGQVFIADKTLNEACLSDHVIRIMIKNEKLSSWVFAFLKSSIGLRILHNIGTGSAILFITSDRLSQLPVPKPDDKDLNIVHELINEYLNNFSKACDLEKKAIQLVENEIDSWQN